MLVASGQGLRAVSSPSRKAVRIGTAEPSDRFCKYSIATSSSLFPDFGAELRLESLRVRAGVGEGEPRQIGHGFFAVPPFIQQQRRPRHLILIGQRSVLQLCNVDNAKAHLPGPDLSGEIGFEDLFHTGFNRHASRAAFCPVETKHFDTIVLRPVGSGFSRRPLPAGDNTRPPPQTTIIFSWRIISSAIPEPLQATISGLGPRPARPRPTRAESSHHRT